MRIPTVVLLMLCLAAGPLLASCAVYGPHGHGGFFAVGGVYRDGRITEGERHLRAVLQRPDASAACTSMAHSFSIVSQLYGLLGLRLADRAAFDRELPAFTRRRDRVETMSGCLSDREEVGQVAHRIARGEYDPYLMRPLR